MSRLLRGELLKLRTTRTALGFAAASVLLVLASVLVTILAGEPDNVIDKRSALNIGGTLSLPLMLFGIVGATAEYRHRTVAAALLVSPNRGRLTMVRMLAYAICGLLVGALMLVVAIAVGLPLLAGTEGPALDGADYLEIAGGGLLAAALSAMIGVGLGVLVKNQVAAVVGTLVVVFIVFPLIPLISEEAARYTLTTAAGGVGGGASEEQFGGIPSLDWGVALLVLIAWAVAFVGAGLIVDRRRDVT